MFRKNIEYHNEKYLYVKTVRWGVIAKSKIYISSQYYGHDDCKYRYKLLKKDSYVWYFAAIVIPICFLIYLLTCVGLGLLAVCAFQFDSIFDKTTYAKTTDHFIDMLEALIRPEYYSYYHFVSSDKPLSDKELVIKTKKMVRKASF